MPACQTKLECGWQFVSMIISNEPPSEKLTLSGLGLVSARKYGSPMTSGGTVFEEMTLVPDAGRPINGGLMIGAGKFVWLKNTLTGRGLEVPYWYANPKP